MEIWKDIIGHEGYKISNTGKVASFKIKTSDKSRVVTNTQQRILTNRINSNGYLVVALRDGHTKSKILYIHRLLGIHFIENPNNLPQINHIDGNRLNNSIENLEWITCSDNVLHGRHVLRHAIGNNHHNAKLTEVKVKDVKHFISLGLSDTDIGVMYGVHRRTISDIRLGKTWISVQKN